MTGHRPFGKICYESERKREKIGGGKMQSLANYMYVCRVQQREGIIEDLIALHDF